MNKNFSYLSSRLLFVHSGNTFRCYTNKVYVKTLYFSINFANNKSSLEQWTRKYAFFFLFLLKICSFLLLISQNQTLCLIFLNYFYTKDSPLSPTLCTNKKYQSHEKTGIFFITSCKMRFFCLIFRLNSVWKQAHTSTLHPFWHFPSAKCFSQKHASAPPERLSAHQ